MTGVMRTPINQHQAFIEPLVAWLRPRGVNFLTGAFVQDIDFAPSPGRMTVDRLDYTRGGSVTSVAVASEDLVLVTAGSQASTSAVHDRGAAPATERTVLGTVDALARGARNSANPTHSSGRLGSPCRVG